MDLELCQLDIDTAFLYASIKEDIYIRQRLGFACGSAKVCHLKRFLYCLELYPREFNTLMRDKLVDQGWKQCMPDPCIYTCRTGNIFAMIALYVNDIPAACNDTSWMHALKATLGARFKIKLWVTFHSCRACTPPATRLPALFRWINRSTRMTS
jgi:hypothetical protein